MIAAAFTGGSSVPVVISAAVGIFGLIALVVKVGDWGGQQEDHLKGQDEKLAGLSATLAKQDAVLDAQNIALAELRTELKALRGDH